LKDYLGLHLRDVPYFRALLRAVEARFYDGIIFPDPVLDLGCGDGHFASLAFETKLEVGVDPWWGPVKEAAKRDSYQHLICAAGNQLPFPNDFFSSAVSNSVLEHIPDIEPVIEETARVLKPGALFIFCVPNHRFLDGLSLGRWLDGLKLKTLADAYKDMFNWISRHHHCDSFDTWRNRLARYGFIVEEHWDYFPPQALRVLEWGHLGGIPSWVSKLMFDRWILVPRRWNLYLADKLVRPHYQADPRSPEGVYSFYITRWQG
jgi:SAM-dependent methyltransferase